MSERSPVLEHELYIPAHATDGATVVVLLHGRGADRTDLFGLRRHLPPEWGVLAPDAPFPGAPWGYGPGRAWYRFLGRNRPDPEDFAASLTALDVLLDAVPSLVGLQPGRIMLGGFSQGGTMSMGYALSRPGRITEVVNFSGFLADHPLVRAVPETVAGTRFFWGHGTSDPAIPFGLAIEGRASLVAAGADLEARDYAIGHWIDPIEIGDMIDWMANQSG